MGELIRIGGLWKQEKADGTTYLSGQFTPGVRMMIFKNINKKAKNHPDYTMFLAASEKKQAGEQREEQRDTYEPQVQQAQQPTETAQDEFPW